MNTDNPVKDLELDLAQFRLAQSTFRLFNTIFSQAHSMEEAAQIYAEQTAGEPKEALTELISARADASKYLQTLILHTALKYKEKK